MKTRLLFAFIALSLAACSSDDGSSGQDPDGNTGEKKLREIVQTEFNENGSVKLTTKTKFDDNDKALLEQQYNGMNELVAKREYTYNTKGVIDTMTYYSAETGLETPNYRYTITYDADGRVSAVNDSFIHNGSPSTSVIGYLYNPNGTVLATRNFSYGGSKLVTYYTNNSGQVYKKTDAEGVTEQVSYLGENILSYNNGSINSVFTFDNEHTPKGQLHNTVVNQYSGNVANAIMLNGFTAISLGITNYAIQRTNSNGDTYEYKYDFDTNGYPIKLRCFKNGASIPFFIKEISYK